MGLVGFGLAGTHHIDGVRRLGFVDVVAIASSDPEAARAKAARYGIPRVYGSYEELAADPDVQVVHNTTPNHLHAPVIRAALKHGKHIISDKPLATSAAEARELLQAAEAAGVVHAVTFNYRGNPLIQEARARIAQGGLGPVHFVHGAYLQDWLLEDTDFSWRVEPEKGGPSCALADIGSHWCDLAEHVTGLRIAQVLADLSTVVKVRQKPHGATGTFLRSEDAHREPYAVTSEDLASVLIRFADGTKGSFCVGQVCAGHKNDLWIEVSGRRSSVRWERDRHEELWLGHRHSASEILPKDPWLLSADARKFARLPGGHPEGYSDDFCNILDEIYGRIRGAVPTEGATATATFADGFRVNCIVDAMLKSHAAGGAWTDVETL